MIDWDDTQASVRDAFRRFVEAEIAPNIREIEHGDEPPYAVLRKMVATFGIGEMAKAELEARLARDDRAARGESKPKTEGPVDPERACAKAAMARNQAAMRLIPIIELSRYCPGMVTAMGVSMGLAAGAILSRGTRRQKEEFALPLLTLEKIGAWAITEPGSGSDAFGAMKSTARRDGEHYVLNGSKTFITNGPFADTIIFICKLVGDDAGERKIVSFVLDAGTPGLVQSKPLKKMGLHSSPTGELFLENVRVPRDRLVGETEEAPTRAAAKETFTAERTAVAAMALGIVEECLKLSTEYAKTRVQFGKAIGEFQLVQLKLAKMAVARMNLRNLVFRQVELAGEGKQMDLAEASACKLYSAGAAVETALEAVQLFGGNGYMAEYRVEQLCRDAKVLQIYGGTDEIQISQIARSLLSA